MKTIFTIAGRLILLAFASANASGQTVSTVGTFQVTNGANPQAPLVAVGGIFYGTTYTGGVSNAGTVFAFNPANNLITTLYMFTNGTDGRAPAGSLVASGNTLYGTASLGGLYGSGTIFSLNTSGAGFSTVYAFTGGQNGGEPEAGLLLSGNTLFGTTYNGGVGNGTVFRVNTNGAAFTNLHSFKGGTNSANPQSSLILAGNTLYGTTEGGSGNGIVFKVNTDGSGFSNVYNFTGGSDGANPEAGLVLSGNTLYGTAYNGGDFDNGTIFSVNTNGRNFQSFVFEYSDGANPQAGLVLVGNMLYGTTSGGGNDGFGTVFAIDTGFVNITNYYSFTGDGDGSTPEAALALLGNTFYGTTQAQSGLYNDGTIFALTLPSLPIPLNIAWQNGQVVLTWSVPSFSLYSSTNVRGATFTNVPGATSPYTNSLTGTARFFELKN